MTKEQLDLARSQSFHTDGQPLLTLDDAREWLDRAGLVLWTLRPQLNAPAPSFVEAIAGSTEPTADHIAQARSLLTRLIREGAAVPLYLMGGVAIGENPDFVASVAALPYIYTLRGDKNWKAAPAASSVSPLASAVYNALKAAPSLSLSELTNQLGREVTQAAVLRSLSELWSTLRVIPVHQESGDEALWELLTARFTKAIKTGGNAGTPTALSALISLYLGCVLIASTDEAESFLSPLIARSKVRDVLGALRAAQELDEVVIDGKTYLHIYGELPEFPEIETPVAEAAEEDLIDPTPEDEREAILERGRTRAKAALDSDSEEKPAPRDDRERRPFTRKPAAFGDRPSRPRTVARKPFDGERKPRTSRPLDGERKPYERKPFDGERKPYDRERKPFAERSSPDGERRPYTRKPFDGERKPYTRKPSDGERRPYERKPFDGERKPRTSRPFDAERKPYERKPFDGERKPYVRKPFDGERKPYAGRSASDGERRPYTRKPFDGERKPFVKKPFDGERKPYERKSFDGERKPYARKPFDGERKPYAGRSSSDGERKPYVRKPFDGERKPYAKKPFDGERKPYERKPFDGDRKPRTSRPFDAENKSFDRPKRPYARRDAAEGAGEDRKTFRPRPAGKPSFGAPKKFASKGPRSFGDKKFGAPKKFGGPSKFGPKKPGGFAKKSAKPRKRPEESSE